MWKRFCNWLLYRHKGWQTNVTIEHPDKYIICLAPHTSNWDFILGQLYAGAEGMKVHFLMKKEWFFWPLGIIFRHIGGIPVCRERNMSMTDTLAATATKEKTFHLCVTPEGTRSANAEWKKGFYFIALKAKIPILLYGIDYEKRLIQCTEVISPSGDIETDIIKIKEYFRDFKGKYPERFAI